MMLCLLQYACTWVGWQAALQQGGPGGQRRTGVDAVGLNICIDRPRTKVTKALKHHDINHVIRASPPELIT